MKNDKNFKIKLVLLWVFAFSVMIFIISMSAKAESPDFPLPYYVDYYKSAYFNDLSFFSDFEVTSQYDFFFITEAPNLESYPTIRVYMCNSSDMRILGLYHSDLTTQVNYEDFDFNQDYVKVSFVSNVPYRRYYYNGSWVYWSGGSGRSDLSNIALLGRSSENKNNYGMTFNVPFLLGDDIYYNGEPIFANGVPTIPDDPLITGIAVVPPQPFIPEYLTGDSAPQNVPPSYTINNYTWTTAPTFDGSSVINGIQSIKDTLEWLSNNLHNELSNLGNNIKSGFEYVGKTFQYYGNAIIETMNNAIQNLYENFVALLEPIVSDLNTIKQNVEEVADLFIHPFDEEEFEEQMESCELINQYNELMDNADDIRAIFNNAEERDYFVLYIDFENPFADSEHKIIHSEISFTWLKDYRSTYRPFLWLFTMIECFVGGMRLLGGIIGGKAK